MLCCGTDPESYISKYTLVYEDLWDSQLPPLPPALCSEAGSYLRLIDSCITQIKAQGPSRTCKESKQEEEALWPCRSYPSSLFVAYRSYIVYGQVFWVP